MPETSASQPRIEVIALAVSAGGLQALTTVLRDLPPDLPTAVVVAQHLGGQGSRLVHILGQRIALPVQWARDGEAIAAGRVTVCPPSSVLEILPDRTCSVRKSGALIAERPLDQLLTSVADSFGACAVVAVLTGMGKDASIGARAVKDAGGTVLVQSEDTAEAPAMPRAAIDAGAADLILPLHEIGRVIAEVVAGGRLPRPRSEIEAAEALFAGTGEIPRLFREIDWAHTTLGPVSGWPVELRTALRFVLESPMPMIVLWGRDLIQLYNDSYRVLMGEKHPAGLGQPNQECWPEVWHLNQPLFARVFAGECVALEDALYPITRHGRHGAMEEAYFSLYHTPVRGEDGAVAGVFMTILETTGRVLAARRLRTLRAMATGASNAPTARAALERALAALARNSEDVPFALGYLLDRDANKGTLGAAFGVAAGSLAAPHTVDLRGGHPAWPLAKALADGADGAGGIPLAVDDLPARFRGFHAGPWPEAPRSALLVPLRPVGDEPPVGILVAGLSPRLALDAPYREFIDLVAHQISASLTEAIVRVRERERLERLAELDRAKTEFFQNVSHEFRTPLTLLLAPLEEALRHGEDLPGPLAGELDVAARNARRLLTLVDTLLDFSQVEAGRLSAHFEPTDLAALTADLAGVFRSAVERVGLRLRVDCPPLPEPVWIDRGMWERVVSNLLSNALKHTFQGEIAVELRALQQHAELVVRDTGSGIPAGELPHLFKRFHRVRGARARTHEGAGIGLALVDELVRRHQGRVRVQSQEGEGTTFTVWIPLGRRPGAERPPERKSANGRAEVAAALAEEAAQWDSAAAAPMPDQVLEDPLGRPAAFSLKARAFGARVLVADDNADLRDYVRRLLAPHWKVETAADGQEALEKARRTRPDLILADVMMPNLDGFGLLREIRRDETLQTTPVMLVTARAGEEAAVEGLLAGADDYLAKPFSARELVARVGTQLELARVRREAGEAIAQREERYRILFEAIDEGFCVVEVLFDDGRPVDYRFLEANPAFVRQTGLVDALGRTMRELAPAHETHWFEIYGRVALSGEPTRFVAPAAALGRWYDVYAFRVGSPEERRVAILFNDVTERKRADEVLRASEARQAFLLRLSDALRPLVDPVEIQGEAARVLGERLDAGRTLYTEQDGDEVVVHRDWVRGVPSMAGRYPSSAWGGEFFAAYLRGEPYVVGDVATDPRLDDTDRSAFRAARLAAFVGVGLVKGGRLVATFGAHSATPRTWTAEEVELVRETAERTWEAVERARAEQALRESREEPESCEQESAQERRFPPMAHPLQS